MKNFFLIVFSSLILAFSADAQRSVISNMRLKRPAPDSTVQYVFSIPENEDYDFFVGALSRPASSILNTLDGHLFRLENDSLFTNYAFDYEGHLGTKFTVLLNVGTTTDTAFVNLSNVTGKWDANGPADLAVASKYPEVNVGDYIFWNYTSGDDLTASVSGVSHPAKVLIHNKVYDKIILDMGNSAGNDTASRVVVTNFLGQVECSGGVRIDNPAFVRFTGMYNSTMGYGHRYFTGCDQNGSKVDFNYSHGKFGFYLNNRWTSSSLDGFSIQTNSTGLEIDHLEIANGFFSGINIKWENNFSVSNFNHIHHNFIHDVGAEGIFVGSTGSFPQQVFQNTWIENNAIVRSGSEGVQVAWLMRGSQVRNNFLHSALDWKDPFARWQDNVMQISVLGGGIYIGHNVLIGAGEAVANIWTKVNASPLLYGPDTLHISNNLIYGARGDLGFYAHSESDGLTQMMFNGNIFGKVGYDLSEVYPAANPNNTKAYSLHTALVSTTIKNTLFDNSIESLYQGTAAASLVANQQGTVTPPDFQNYMGMGQNFNHLKVSRYTGYIGTETKFPSSGTNKGTPASWEVGDVVQWRNLSGETRFYQCIVPESSGNVAPPMDDSNNSHWQLLKWTKPNGSLSFFPPDDIQLVAGSYYDQREIGVREVISGSTTVPSANQLPTISITNIDNNDTVAQATMVSIETVTSDPDGTVDSVRFSVDGKTLTWSYAAPFSASYLADSSGIVTVRATAYDNSGDSIVSGGINLYVSDENYFEVLHYTETSGFEHGTRIASYALLQRLGLQHGFSVTDDSTGSSFNTLGELQKYAVVIFSNTSGDQILDATQRASFEAYLNGGGSFIGIHAAGDSYRHSTANGSGTGTWDWYAEMLGASVQNSPNHTAANYSGTISKVGVHPTTTNLPNPWNKADEYYYWENGYYNTDNNPVLQVAATGSQSYDAQRPVSWFKYLPNGGRSFYTSLGHSAAYFNSDPDFEDHIRQAILWSVNNPIPLVTVTAPSANDTVIAGDMVNITASATDPNGTVDSVEFKAGTQTIAWDYASPWATNYTTTNGGNLSITAIGYDNDGGAGVSNPVNIYVNDTTTGDTIILAGNTIEENWYARSLIGLLSGSANYRLPDTLDNKWFHINGDSLQSNTSFNYEAFSNYKVWIESDGAAQKFQVNIIDISGKYDQNVIADADHAAKYHDVVIGDLLIVQPTNNHGDIYYANTGSLPGYVSFPNQIKIRGGQWKSIVMNLTGCEGNSRTQPVIVTNWMGQTESQSGFSWMNPVAVRFTGEYNPSKRTGNKHYRGEVADAFKQGTFGIYGNNQWTDGVHAFAVGGDYTHVEIDHVEVAHGFYSGFNIKQDNGQGDPDSNYIHDNFAHDLENEGFYMGNTKKAPQQRIKNSLVENNLFVRNGSETQWQRLLTGNTLRNNVTWSGLCVVNPFQNYQFGNEQAGWLSGDNVQENNLWMGGGDILSFNGMKVGEATPNGDTNFVRNNFYGWGRHCTGIYLDNETDYVTPIVYDGNFFYNIGYDMDKWYVKADTTGGTAFQIGNGGNPVFIRNNTFDNSLAVCHNTRSNIISSNNVRGSVASPQFINPLGHIPFNPQRVYFWTDIKWKSTLQAAPSLFHEGLPMIFEAGDIVLHHTPKADKFVSGAHETRLYRCIKTHSGVEPTRDGDGVNWEVIKWTKPDGTTTYIPPDDFRLVPGTIYHQKGMGIN